MKLFTSFILSTLIFSSVFAQCPDMRYWGYSFTAIDTTENVHYSTNIDRNNNSVDLLMDVYEPNGDSEPERPLVILAHGGTFISGDKDDERMVDLAQKLTR